MIVSVDLNEQDKKRLDELKKTMESTSQSDVIRKALRELHKKIFA